MGLNINVYNLFYHNIQFFASIIPCFSSHNLPFDSICVIAGFVPSGKATW